MIADPAPVPLVPLATIAPAAVEALLDRAFGPDRHTRTAYAIRGAARPIPALSIAAVDAAGRLVGSIQCWPVAIMPDDGTPPVAMTMVGPVAVDPAHQQAGLGRRLMTAALAAATATGDDAALMLIGDPEYYGRFFGFTADRTAAWRVPGPVERHRLLARGDAVPAVAGAVGPRLSVAA